MRTRLGTYPMRACASASMGVAVNWEKMTGAYTPAAATPAAATPAKTKPAAQVAKKRKKPATQVAKKQSALPAPAARLRPRARHAGGRPVEHKWESVAQYGDRATKEKKLRRNSKGEPIKADAVDLMIEGFKAVDPPPPKDPRQVRGWLDKHFQRTRGWWEPKKQGQN